MISAAHTMDRRSLILINLSGLQVATKKCDSARNPLCGDMASYDIKQSEKGFTKDVMLKITFGSGVIEGPQ